MRFLARLLMDPHQKALTRPEDFKRPLDPAQIKAEIRAQVTDHESRELMLDAVSGFGPQRPLTLAGVVDDLYSLQDATRRETDRHLHEFGVGASLGAHFVVGFLTRRANQLADGIKPGAQAALGDLL